MKTLTYNNQTIKNTRMLINLSFFLALVFCVPSISVAAPGTELIKDINQGAKASNIFNLDAGSQRLFFMADDGSNGMEVWTSNGAIENAERLTDTSIGTNVATELRYSNKNNNIVVNNIYYFSLRSNETREHELWRSDGSVSGTFKLIDLPDYLDDRTPAAGADGLYYFVPWSDPDYGRELWVSDGTIAGTRMVKDINPGTGSSSPHDLMEANDRLYFLVGNDLWTSDGTSGGTRLLANLGGHYTEDMRYITHVNGTIYLAFLSGQSGTPYELWRHDIDSGQTLRVKGFDGFASDGQNYTAVGDLLFFVAKGIDSDTFDLWKSDGSPDGTILVKKGPYRGAIGSMDLTNVDGTLFFIGSDEEHGRELWKSNGTASGTFMVKDINGTHYGSDLNCFTAVGNTLFFVQKKTNYVKNLWMSDGTEAGTMMTDMGVSNLKCPVNFNEQLYFYGNDRTNKDFGTELYRYNLSDNEPVVPVAPEVGVSTNGIKVTISWNGIANADGYTLYFAPYPFTGPETIGNFDLGNTTNFSIDLWNGAAYYIAITSRHSDLESAYSNIGLFIIRK